MRNRPVTSLRPDWMIRGGRGNRGLREFQQPARRKKSRHCSMQSLQPAGLACVGQKDRTMPALPLIASKMHDLEFVECGGQPLPDVEGVALVASSKLAKFVPVEVGWSPDGGSWRRLVLGREGCPGERISIQAVSEAPLVFEIRLQTEAKCGPIAFFLAMETQGRTGIKWPVTTM